MAPQTLTMAAPTLATSTPTTTTTATSPIPGSAPSSATLRESSADLYSSYFNSSDSENEDLDDAAISRLLREAEERMRNVSSSSSAVVARTEQKKKPLVVSLPKLDPGVGLPRSAVGGVGGKTVRPVRSGVEIEMVTEKDVLNMAAEATKGKGKKEGPAPTAGSQWFDLPRTDLTNPTILRDHLLLKSRNVLDPHRHYKKDSSALPEFSAVGTIIEGNTEFYSSRIAKKERKKTIVEEILADGKSRERFKRKYEEVQGKKRSGKKADYKKLMEKRRRVKYAK